MTDNRRYFAEALGTGLLVMAGIGSGIMAENLSGGNAGLVLLSSSIATGAALYVLIELFGPISGAHINPIVSLWFALTGRQSWKVTLFYVAAQLAGGIASALLTNLMFDLPVLQIADTARTGMSLWLGETVASFGLVLVIAGCLANKPQGVGLSVALYITSAYWFTSSAAFANPAITIARMFSDTFAGIAPASVVPFIAAQIIGMLLAWAVGRWLFDSKLH